MEPAMRRAAIHSMDAADDSWNMNDPLLDAERKVEVLQDAMLSLEQAQRKAEASAATEIDEQTQYLKTATDTIEKQIQELRDMLQSEQDNVAETCEHIRTALQQKHIAIQREGARYQAAMERLSTLAATFPPTAE
jgi:biopolymer transport protein ExbB/TolQ